MRPLAAAVLLVAFTGITGCGDDGPNVPTAEVGECLVDEPSLVVFDLDTTDCDAEHEAEVVFAFDSEGDDDDFDSVDLDDEAQERCAEAFEDYVGISPTLSSLGLSWVQPTEETWQAGDRSTICIATAPDGESLDESVEGQGDDFVSEDGQAIADLVDGCEDGDDAACDELYFSTPVGSPEEEIGATCGGRSDEELDGTCETTLGGGADDESSESESESDEPGSDDSGSGSGSEAGEFDDLIDACEGGDNAACDDLWLATPVGSDEERIGATCGGRSEVELEGRCEATLGE